MHDRDLSDEVYYYVVLDHFNPGAQLVMGITPQRPSGQAVVTGAFLSPPRYMDSFLSHIGFGISTVEFLMLVDFHRVLSFASSRSL